MLLTYKTNTMRLLLLLLGLVLAGESFESFHRPSASHRIVYILPIPSYPKRVRAAQRIMMMENDGFGGQRPTMSSTQLTSLLPSRVPYMPPQDQTNSHSQHSQRLSPSNAGHSPSHSVVNQGQSQRLSPSNAGHSPSHSVINQGQSQRLSPSNAGHSPSPSVVNQGQSQRLSPSNAGHSPSPSVVNQGQSQRLSPSNAGHSPSNSVVNQGQSQRLSPSNTGHSPSHSVVNQGQNLPGIDGGFKQPILSDNVFLDSKPAVSDQQDKHTGFVKGFKTPSFSHSHFSSSQDHKPSSEEGNRHSNVDEDRKSSTFEEGKITQVFDKLAPHPNRNPMCNVLPDPGTCRAALPRYYLDPETGTCNCYLYGGCTEKGAGESRGSFLTLEECQRVCHPPNMEEGPVCKDIFKEDQFVSFLVEPLPPQNTKTDHLNDEKFLALFSK